MDYAAVAAHISGWLDRYCNESRTQGFVVGISGGIDSAVTSVLCAMTGRRTIVLSLPIRQSAGEFNRAEEHIAWLKKQYPNVESHTVELTLPFEGLEAVLPKDIQDFMTMANARARLRMLTLYTFASRHKLIVAGTGNKVEDFGVGFFTKYGDGGVDISPIADLYKSEVRALARQLGIAGSIVSAAPTDGLFTDGRTDEDQLGATYDELEWAMDHIAGGERGAVNERQKHVLEIYKSRNAANRHKMVPIPVCVIPGSLRK